MRTIILAGGYATRLWPITKEIAKPLLPIGRQRIIDLIMQKLEEVRDIEEVLITTNRYFYDQFEDWLSQRNFDLNVKLIMEDTLKEEQKLGSIGAIYYLLEKYGYDDDYMIIAGDNIFSFSLKDFVDFYKIRNSTVIAVYNIKDKKEAKRFGVVEVDDEGRIKLFLEKPEKPPSSLISTGCYIFPKRDIILLKEYVERRMNKDSPGRFIQWLYRLRPIYAFEFSGYWFDVGTPDAYLDAFKFLTKESYISETAEISNSKVKGPIIIMDDSKIEESTIGPYSFIGSHTEISLSRVSNSILFQNIQLSNVHLDRTIIGSKAIIKNIKLKHSIIGPFSKIDGQT